MNYQELIEIIEKHNLSIRRIPEVIVEKFFVLEGYPKELKEDESIEYWKPDMDYFLKDRNEIQANNAKDKFYSKFPEGRRLLVKTRKPTIGGKYVVKSVNDSNSTVMFSSKRDFWGDTLEESINKFLDSLK